LIDSEKGFDNLQPPLYHISNLERRAAEAAPTGSTLKGWMNLTRGKENDDQG
jgi:hypothetical protein